MLEEVEYFKGIVMKRFNKPLKMTENDELRFKQMDECHICGDIYTGKDVCVRDHCHIMRKFRYSARQECNLRLRITLESIKIPVVFPQGGTCQNFNRDARPLFLGLKFGQILSFWVGKFFSYFSEFRKISAIFWRLTKWQLFLGLPIFVSHTWIL